MSLTSLIRFRLGLRNVLTFHGVPVPTLDNQVTCRLIEDIWMRGEYDIPGFVPQTGWRVVDIGANVGIFAMLAASRGAYVVSYEPHPESCERLRANTAKWAVVCHQNAVVGLARGPVSLYVHDRHTRNTLVLPSPTRRCEFSSGRLKVPSVAISEVLDQPCDLLKVDCEGGEFEIFANATNSIRQARRIIAEVHGAEGDVNELVRSVQNAGFDVRLYEPHPGLSFQMMTAVRR